MANNDAILLDHIIQSSKGIDFEVFSLSQYFKNYDLSEDEISTGIIDGCDDAGIDAIYIFENGVLIDDVINKNMSNKLFKLDLFFITSKHDDSFKMAPIDAMLGSLLEFLDLKKTGNDLVSSYNKDFVKKREIFLSVLKDNFLNLDTFNIHVVYLSRGDTKKIADSVKNRSNFLQNELLNLMPNANIKFDFVGCSEILSFYRKSKNRNSKLKYISMLNDFENYVFLVGLKEYYDFISEDDCLKNYFFDSNIRSYLGENRVNRSIMQSLINKKNIDFWNLNNGITILADKAIIFGNTVQIENVQIVNGLQTSQSIYEYFVNNHDEMENRKILVKLVVSEDKEIKDDIIKSTNNQTAVEISALKATDKIQRDIELRLLKDDLYYERRTNYYFNSDIDVQKIITPLFLASASVSLILKYPYQAIKVKPRFIGNEKNYNIIFDDQFNIDIWPVVAKIYKKVEMVLLDNDIYTKTGPKFLKYMRPLLSYLTVCKIFGTFNYKLDKLINFDFEKMTRDYILEVLKEMYEITSDFDGYDSLKKRSNLNLLFSIFSSKNNIKELEFIIKRNSPFLVNRPTFNLSEDFIEMVKSKLPPSQPWPVGTHSKIARELNEFTPKVSQAIHLLEDRGYFYKQVGQKLYDSNGKEIEDK